MWPDGWTVVPVAGVSVDISAPPFHAECTWPTRGRGAINTVLTVSDTQVAGGGLLASPTRINLLSASAREGLVRSADLEGDRRSAFKMFLKQLAALLVELYQQQQPVATLSAQPEAKPIRWMLYPIWPDSLRPTALVAAHGSLKTYAALACAYSVATGLEVLRGNTRPQTQTSVLFLDFEADQTEIERRLTAMARGIDADIGDKVRYMEMRLPLSDVVADVVTAVGNHGCGAVVIDSMSAAIGGSLIDDDSVNGFWSAVRGLGVPTLVTAHKSVENQRRRGARFFGSSMSENRVQMAWNVEREKSSDRVMWECFKDNNGRLLWTKLAWEWGFTNTHEDEDTVLEAVTADAINPRNVNLRNRDEKGGTVADGIAQILEAEGAMMPGEIGQQLMKPAATIRTTLHRYTDRFTKLADGRWDTITDAPETLPIPL